MGLLPSTATDNQLSTQTVSVLALGAIEVAVRASAATRKRLWGAVVLGRDYEATGEWTYQLESLAVQAFSSSHVEITGTW